MAVYLYCIKHDYQYQTAIKDRSFKSEWFKLEPDGTITIRGTYKKGYAWDGCSPKIKFKDVYFGTKEAVLNYNTGHSKTYYASLVHDVFYQFSPKLKKFIKRIEVDNEFYSILKRDSFYFAKLYYRVVRCFGWLFWGKPH